MPSQLDDFSESQIEESINREEISFQDMEAFYGQSPPEPPEPELTIYSESQQQTSLYREAAAHAANMNYVTSYASNYGDE